MAALVTQTWFWAWVASTLVLALLAVYFWDTSVTAHQRRIAEARGGTTRETPSKPSFNSIENDNNAVGQVSFRAGDFLFHWLPKAIHIHAKNKG